MRDLPGYIGLLLLAGYFLYVSIMESSSSNYSHLTYLFPTCILLLLGIASLLGVIQVFKQITPSLIWSRLGAIGSGIEILYHQRRLLIVSLILCLSTYFLIPWCGLFPSLFVLMILFMLLLGEKRWHCLVLLPVTFVVSMIILLNGILNLPLPAGQGIFSILNNYLLYTL